MEEQTINSQPSSEPIIPPVQPMVAPIEPAMPKKSLLVPILVTLLILAVSAAAYFFLQSRPTPEAIIDTASPTSTPVASADLTADWQTYNNDKYNFSFKYPQDYSKIENYVDPSESIYYISIMSPLGTHPPKETTLNEQELKIEIYITKSPEGDTIENFMPTNAGENSVEIGAGSLTIQGLTAQYRDWEGMGSGRTIYLIAGGYRYTITKYPLITNREEEFDQILSTFQFTKLSTTNNQDETILQSIITEMVFAYGKSHGLTSRDQIIIDVEKLEGNYARGTTSFTPEVEGSGNIWFATKIDGNWSIVEETQEPPSCQIMQQYSFPQSVSGECIDK